MLFNAACKGDLFITPVSTFLRTSTVTVKSRHFTVVQLLPRVLLLLMKSVYIGAILSNTKMLMYEQHHDS